MCALPVNPYLLPPGAVVVVQDPDARWTARLITHLIVCGAGPSGVSFVEVIDPGESIWRSGLVVPVATVRLRRVVDTYPTTCSCRWQYRTEHGDWVIFAIALDCPHHRVDADYRAATEGTDCAGPQPAGDSPA